MPLFYRYATDLYGYMWGFCTSMHQFASHACILLLYVVRPFTMLSTWFVLWGALAARELEKRENRSSWGT